MDDLFLLVFLGCVLALIIGLIKPRLVVHWGDVSKRTRGKVLKTYGIFMIICFVGFGMTTEDTSETVTPTGSVSEKIVVDTPPITEESNVEPITPTEEPVASSEDLHPKTFEEEIIAAIGDTIQVNSIDIDEDTKDLYITVEMGDNLTTNMIKLGIEKTAAHVFKNVFPLLESREDIEMITYVSETSFVDKYGNESKDNACIISMDKETYSKINWDNFLTENLKSVATSYYLHPTFKK